MESPTIMILFAVAAWTLGAGTSSPSANSPSASRHARRARGRDDRTHRMAITLTSSSCVCSPQRSRRVCDPRARNASGLALISSRVPRTKVAEHGHHPTVLGACGRQAELREDAAHVSLEGLRADVQPFTDGLVGAALRHQGQDRALARCQLLQALVRLPTWL